MKLQDKFAESLKSEGFVEVKGRSSKYRVFSKSGKEENYYLGKNGAVRKGKNIADSISLTRFYNVKTKNEK